MELILPGNLFLFLRIILPVNVAILLKLYVRVLITSIHFRKLHVQMSKSVPSYLLYVHNITLYSIHIPTQSSLLILVHVVYKR